MRIFYGNGKYGSKLKKEVVKVAGAGFGTDTNVVTIFTKDKERILDKLSKLEVAKKIFDEIVRNF